MPPFGESDETFVAMDIEPDFVCVSEISAEIRILRIEMRPCNIEALKLFFTPNIIT